MSSKLKLSGTREAVEQLISKNLDNSNVCFVFPTDISATVWAERVIDLSSLGGTVALERFTAWDKFKSESIKSQQQNKTAIPATLRKLFATNFLEKNKQLVQEEKSPLFTSLVVPSFVESSLSFKDWIASLLPQLSSWYEKAQVGQKIVDLFDVTLLDSEDQDLLTLYNEYKTFLDVNKLFDPAWEKPPFNDDGKIWYIIYPQILTDFEEYRSLLESAENVYLVDVPDEKKKFPEKSSIDLENYQKPIVHTYDNAREELHALALYLRKIMDGSNNSDTIAWQDIALSVPDIETLGPYLTRELNLYNIPYQLRAGKKLSQYPAGRLFALIQECVSSDFSFDSVSELVLDKTFPWGDEQAINQLIDFGIKNNCLCSYEDEGKKIDVWQEAFSKAIGEERAKVFIFGGKFGDEDSKMGLKRAVTAICNAKDFAEISKHYFAFRKEFFDINAFSNEADLILSRCITELQVLIQLQEEYGEAARCKSPFSFFCTVLDQKDYLAQTDVRGVNIFPYRLAASAPYKQQIVLGASQKALSVTNQPLSFLSDEKRKQLGVCDSVLSQSFINLYAGLSQKKAYFSCSNKNFGVYSLPHDAFQIKKSKVIELTDFTDDAWVKEKRFFMSPDSSNVDLLHTIHDIQQKGFLNWIKTYQTDESKLGVGSTSKAQTSAIQNLQKCILDTLYDTKKQKIRVSASTLNKFTECPIKWLFSRILKVDEASLDATLMDSVWVGDIYHEIIRRVLEDIKAEKTGILFTDQKLPDRYIKSINKHCQDVIDEFPASCNVKKPVSPLTLQMLKMQKEAYSRKLKTFFTSFCQWFEGSFVSSTEQNVAFEPEDKNWFYDGRLDCCLDYQGNERMDAGKFIIDFKTGGTPNQSDCLQQKGVPLSDFQLAMYVKLYEQSFTFGTPSVMGAGFFSIFKASPTVVLGTICYKSSKTNWNPKSKKNYVFRDEIKDAGIDFNESLKHLDTVAQYFVDCITDKTLYTFLHPDFSKIPYKTCSECKFKGICRTTYSISSEETN